MTTPVTPPTPPAPAPAPAPVAPIPPKFNPTDPLSITWYVTAILTVLGFALKKDLTSYAGPIAMGVFALVGIAIGIVQAIKTHSFNMAMASYNAVRLDHYVVHAKYPSKTAA